MKTKMILLLSLLLTVSVLNAIPAEGHFDASKSCPAYLSKNKKSNPDNIYTQPDTRYQIKEINKANPNWFRVKMSDDIGLRWVEARCGFYEYNDSPYTQTCDHRSGMADAYVLALSWQPAFCETYGYEAGKQECLKLKEQDFTASHFGLHGLWPNQAACGQNYGFCNANPRRQHCDYPPVGLSTQTQETLKIYMPAFAHGSCLERHEWFKHGSCQILPTNDYFRLAMRLVKEVNESSLGVFMHKNKGQTVSKADLMKAIRESFGSNNTQKFFIGCKNGLLVDIYIKLPALIPFKSKLKDLVNDAQALDRTDSCPGNIGISDFTGERWFSS